jgi:hypothetical protein
MIAHVMRERLRPLDASRYVSMVFGAMLAARRARAKDLERSSTSPALGSGSDRSWRASHGSNIIRSNGVRNSACALMHVIAGT